MKASLISQKNRKIKAFLKVILIFLKIPATFPYNKCPGCALIHEADAGDVLGKHMTQSM